MTYYITASDETGLPITIECEIMANGVINVIRKIPRGRK